MKLVKDNNNPINHKKNINELTSLSIDINDNLENNKDIINYSNIIYTLFVNNYNFLTDNKNFYNRDRIIIDNDSLSSLFYSAYFLSGAEGEIDNLKDKKFIKDNYSIFTLCPDAIAYSVGASYAEKYVQSLINNGAVDYKIYSIVSYNLLSAVSLEAALFAGDNNLNNLVIISCSNDIIRTKDVYTNLSFDVFTASNNYDSLVQAYNSASKSSKPSLILVDNIDINYDTSNISEIKSNLDVRDIEYSVSTDVMEDIQYLINERVKNLEDRFSNPIATLDNDSMTLLKSLTLNNKRISSSNIVFIPDEDESLLTLTDKLMNSYYKNSRILIGSSTYDDSNKINFSRYKYSSAYIINGMCESGLRPYLVTDSNLYKYFIGASFYAKENKLPIIYIINNKESHLNDISYLRASDIDTFIPCDSNELLGSLKAVMSREEGISSIIVNDTPVKSFKESSINSVANGGYTLFEEKLNFDGILISDGPSMHLVKEVSDILFSRGIDLRVVSIPNLKRFLKEKEEYKDSVLPVEKRKVIIENSNSSYWNKIVFNSKYILNYKDFDELKNDPKLFAEKIEQILK